MIYKALKKQEKIPVHLKKQAHIRALLFNKALIKILATYSNFNIIFLTENIVKLLKNFKINKYIIKLKKDDVTTFEIYL